tara:strand:+ start:2545 stop:4365 length:1821 start_codon:yes stop_codon:yes gene_type:complete
MAGLIPQAFIDDLLNRTDIVEVIDKRVTLKKAGKNHTACCPFHQEKTPSFSVQPDRQFYYCFGCGAGGNVIGFVMNFDQLDFPLAVETLAREAGLEVPKEESKAASKRRSENVIVIEVLEQASKFYQYQLRQHENKQVAVDYLKSRGVSGEIAKEFCLGYAPPGWDNLLSGVGTDVKKQQALLKAGLVIEKEQHKSGGSDNLTKFDTQYYDRFRHRIMFPIRDNRGRTIAFGGRVLGEDKPKYLNSPETAVFQKGSELYGLFEAKKSSTKFNRLLLVEGYMDVIALNQMDITNAVATLGTATSVRHLTRMFRQSGEIVFCFDGDDAGRAAAWRALETTMPHMEDGRQVKFLFLPEGSDPDTYVRSVGKEQFEKEVDKSTPLETFFFAKLSQNLDTTSIEGKARLSNLAKPLLRQLPRGVYAQLMLDRLSETLGVSSESFDQLLERSPPAQTNADVFSLPDAPPLNFGPNPKNHSGKKLASYRKPSSLKAIELLLRNPEIALSIAQDLKPLHSAEDESRKLLLSLIEMVRKNPNTDTYTLLGYCYGTNLRTQLTQLLKSERITPQEGIEEEFNHIIANILSDIAKKLDLLELRGELNSRVSATKDSN